MSDKKKNYHEGHRQRIKERFLTEGLDSFEDHQVLELILFYAIPYRDTNELAYRLLEEFGSLSGVLEADYYDLQKVDGVGKNAASFLTLLPFAFRRYQKDKYSAKILLETTESLGKYAMDLFIGRVYEAFYLLCLDSQNKLNRAALIQEGTINEVTVYPRIMVEIALRHKAKTVVLVHNHPSGLLRPTAEDMTLTWKMIDVMRDINITVADHIIVGNGKYYSFSEHGVLTK